MLVCKNARKGNQRFFIILMIILIVSPILFSRQENREWGGAGRVIVSYRLNKLNHMASNQLAVWVEDENGEYLDTLHATRFTAEGGYHSRPDALRLWMETMRNNGASEALIDSLSSATQQAGRYELVWDCMDFDGKPVPPGEYVIKMEGNLFWKNRFVWEGRIQIGGNNARTNGQYTFHPPTAASMQPLVEGVVVRYEPE